MKKRASQPTPAEPASAAPPPPAKKAAARKKSSSKSKAAPPPSEEPTPSVSPTLTTIAARVDVGFGNTLFIRGNGPGLSWDIGVPMSCLCGNVWSVDLTGATQPIYFKFLINDEIWCSGPDYVVNPGAQLEVTPYF